LNVVDAAAAAAAAAAVAAAVAAADHSDRLAARAFYRACRTPAVGFLPSNGNFQPLPSAPCRSFAVLACERLQIYTFALKGSIALLDERKRNEQMD